MTRSRDEWTTHLASVKELVDNSRAEAWFPHDVVAGRKAAHFTLERWLFLQEGKNAFITGEIPLGGDVIQFLWAIEPGAPLYALPPRKWNRVVARLDWREVVKEIAAYLDRQLVDMIGGGKDSNTSLSAAHWVAYWIHRMAELYGWEIETILRTPLPRLIQLDRLDRYAKGDGSALVSRYTTEMTAMIHDQKRSEEVTT